MTWQRSLQAAVRALRREENSLKRQLQSVRTKIAELDEFARSGGPKSARSGRKASSRRLSPQGRAAISKAAKKRWAEYRRKKKAR